MAQQGGLEAMLEVEQRGRLERDARAGGKQWERDASIPTVERWWIWGTWVRTVTGLTHSYR